MTQKASAIRNIAYAAMGTSLIAVCALITVPALVPFTMQTFAVFAVAGLLGLRLSLCSVAAYALLGAFGAPVFSGGTGGVGILLGKTGGYILGFFFIALAVGAVSDRTRAMKRPKRAVFLAVSMVAGLFFCYAFGTAWYIAVYMRAGGAITLFSALSWCVFPFVAPDLIKAAAALMITVRVGNALGITPAKTAKKA